MKSRHGFRILSTVLVVTAISLLLFFGRGRPAHRQMGGNQIALRPPAFVQAAGAAADAAPGAIASVLDREAGISAYAQTTPFALDDIRHLFTTIEHETADYILGTMTVPDNWGDFDVHVYAHKSGWLLAYYLRTQPAVTVFDWQAYTGSPGPVTRFQAVIDVITATLNRSDLSLTYYDFRYPDATNLFLAVEDVQAYRTGDSFQILDTDFVYYERSWLLGGRTTGCSDYACTSYAKLDLDGVEIKRFSAERTTFYRTGFLDATQLSASDPHTVYVYVHSNSGDLPLIMGALAIVYGPQP
jgi:hypothetical protein